MEQNLIEKNMELITIKTKSAALTNYYCAYLRKRGYKTTIVRVQDGYAITIYGLNSGIAYKLVGAISKKYRLMRQRQSSQTQKQAQKVA